MFSGIIRNLVEIRNLKKINDYFELEISNPGLSPDLGDSIMINGVCLTVTKYDDSSIFFDLLLETIDVTNLNEYYKKRISLDLFVKYLLVLCLL